MSRIPLDQAAFDTGRETARGELSLALFGIPGVSLSNCDDPAQIAKAVGMARGMIAEASGWISVLEGPDALAGVMLACVSGVDDESAKAKKEQG